MASASFSFRRAIGSVSSSSANVNRFCRFQQATILIRRSQSASSKSSLWRYHCSLPAMISKWSSNSTPSKLSFSTVPTPFSRKKPVKVIPGEKGESTDIEPRVSFNFQATLGILQIARAVSPVVSMNAGYTLTSNYDLRVEGTFLI